MNIEDTVGRALEQMALGQEAQADVWQLLQANVESRRIQKFLDNGTTVADYVARVVKNYQRWYVVSRRLQVERSPQEWSSFYVMLQKWAHAFLKRRSFPEDDGQRAEHALACATEAAVALLNTPYPCDVHFERWAYVILQHICLQHIERHWGSADALQRNPIALDEFEDWVSNVAADGAEEDVERGLLRRDLLEAVEELASEARRELIRLRYFEQLTFAEIAEKMDRRKNTLYKLHFDALADLREVWWVKGGYDE